MKITRITIENLIGIAHIDVDLAAPIAVFAGANHAGKSSVREAVRAALLGMPERVLKKKDLGQLVHDDAKHGSVVIDFDGGQATFTAPKGVHDLKHDLTMADWERQSLALPYCLDPAMFAQASADERRRLLFALSGASSKPEDIVTAMHERGLTDEVIKAVTPMLRAGFPACAKMAEERCRDAKAAWKAVTRETYGPVKAEGWKAQAPEVDTTTIEQLKTRVEILKGKISTERTRLGAAQQKLKTWQDAEESRQADQKTFEGLGAIKDKLARDEAELQKWTALVQQLEQRAGTGPRVGLVHDLAAWLLVTAEHIHQHGPELKSMKDVEEAIALYEKQYGEIGAQGDPEAAEKLLEAVRARDLMQRCVDNDRRDIETAKAAGARLEQKVEKGSEAEITTLQESLRAASQELATTSADLASLQDQQRAADSAARRTKEAAAAHQDAQDWQAAIDSLSSDGIPADILLKSLGPVNRELARASTTFEFARVEIVGSDIDIYADGRPYALLSESERWRADTQIALALADLSGLRLVALDRVDILDLPSRADCLGGLDAMVERGQLETALVFGTFKKLPRVNVFAHAQGYWIEEGRITETTMATEEVEAA